MNRIPKRLKQEPLIEAIWQVQFEPTGDMQIGDLLPGMLYAALRNDHPQLQLHRLPAADIPPQVAQIDPNLRHVAKYRMEETGLPFLFQVGDRTVTLNCRRPYAGWDAFKAKTVALIDILDQSGLIPVPQRHSLRYIDLLEMEPAPNLSALQLSIGLGTLDTQAQPLQIRLELRAENCMHIVQIATPTEAALPEGIRIGSVIDIETVPVPEATSWQGIRDQLDQLHTCSKQLFFEQILTTEAIERLEPEY